MNKSKIKYVAFYNDNKLNNNEGRNTFLALTNKVNYICSALYKNSCEVEIISPCWSNNTSGYYKGNSYKIFDGVELKNFSTFGSNNIITKKLKQFYSAIQLILYLIKNTEKNEQIIVYHSLALIIPISIVRLIKNLEVILEVEEIYTDVWDDKPNKNKEIRYINKAYKYIFVSDILKKIFGNKPNVVLYGSYLVFDEKFKIQSNNKLINIVYAGSIDEIRSGALNSVLCMRYLSDNYRMNILGFGESKSINKLKQEIKLINTQKGFECCKYYGTLVGSEYNNFLSNCDIGLNPQIQGDYMNTAFPSKILSYLSHNLKVVSTNIESIKISKIAPYIIFADDDLPESVAKAISTINKTDDATANISIINQLDEEFIEEIKNLISSN